MKAHIALLNRMNACGDAVAFANQHRSLRAAWVACPRADWMLWLLDRIRYEDDRAFRLFSCWCVRNTPLSDGRKVWDLLADERSRNAVEVSERYAKGEITGEKLAAAWAAAWAAAGDAARAAAWAAAGDTAGDTARDTARDAAWDAARAAAWAAQADQLRIMFPWAKVGAQLKKHSVMA